MLWDYLSDLNKEGKTILLTTHYIEEAEKLCNEIAIINDGNIIKQGDTKSIINEVSLSIIEMELIDENNIVLPDFFEHEIDNKILRVYSKQANKDIVKIINHVEKQTKIKNINIINSSLEDAFLKLTN